MTTTHLETVKSFLDNGRIDEIRQPSTYGNLKVILIQGTDQVSIAKGRDGKWRYGYHSTYGNGSFINGEGCDASGYVITDSKTVARLEAITR